MHLTVKKHVANGSIYYCSGNCRSSTPQKLLRVMRITAVILLAACLTATAGGYGQKINLQVKKASLEQVLQQLEKQTPYTFTYATHLLKVSQPVTVKLQQATIEQALEACLSNQPLTYSIIDKTVVLKQKVPEQQAAQEVNKYNEPPPPPPLIDVKGRVVDEEGKPVAGASVQVKGDKSKGVSTNADGYFELKGLDEKAVLLVSGVNIENREVKVSGKTALGDVVVKVKVAEGEEVVLVNTGYEQLPKERSAGAFAVIDNKLLNEQFSPNIVNRLKNVSNLYFDQKNVSFARRRNPISLRGLSTINGTTDPLIVLDNFPYEGDINNINPDDIENITILKDATATSIWGAKSANGVIVITTKKSKYNQPVAVGFSTSISVSDLPDLVTYPQLSVKDYIEVESYLFSKNYRLSDTASILRPPLTPLYEMLLKRKYGKISAGDSSAFVADLLSVNPEKEYLDNFYRNALTQQYNLSLNGGGNKFTWLMSGSYNHISNMLLANSSQRKNFRIVNRYFPIDNLDISVSLYYTNSSENTSPTPAYNSVKIGSKAVPYLRFRDADGNPIAIDRDYRGIYTDTAGNGNLLNWKFYPVEDYQYQTNKSSLTSLLWNASISYRFLRNFNALLNYQQEQQQTELIKHSSVNSFFTRDIINSFTSKATSSSGAYVNNVPIGDVYSIQEGKQNSYNARAQLNYAKTWNRIAFNTLLGGEIRERKTYGGNSMTLYGYIADPLSYGTVNYNIQYPTYVNGSSMYISGAPIPGNKIVYRFISTYTHGAATYDKKYTFNYSLRQDAANTFGLSINDKWNPFWSIGGAWDIINEKFVPKNLFSNLRIRTTIGIGGNVDNTKTALLVLFSGTEPATNYSRRRVNSLNNPSLRWEKSKQMNIALDFSSTNDRIRGSVDYYFKKGTDLFGPDRFDYTAWGMANQITKNVAAMKGKGFEIALNTRNIISPFIWETNFLFNYNSHKVTDYYLTTNQTVAAFIAWEGRNITPIVGMPLYGFAAYRWGGLNEKGDPQGYLNGELSTDYAKIFESSVTEGQNSTIVFKGTADPKYFGAVINRFGYKSFSISANISYRLDYYFMRPSLSYNLLYASGTGHNEYQDRWQNPGDENLTNVPAIVYTNYPQFVNRSSFYRYADINILRGDHVRLEYINIAYALKTSRKRALKNLMLTANIANLGILWRKNKQGLDPDFVYTQTAPKLFTFGIKADF